MANANFALASQRMNTGGSPGGLSPVALSGDAAGTLRAPQVSANAGNVQWSNMAIPQIVPDQTVSQAGKAMSVMAQAAFQYQERVEQATADQVVLEAKKLREASWYGTEDNPGYMGLRGQAAVSGRGAYMSGQQKITADAMDGLTDSVKAKVTIRLQSSESDFRSRASVHGAQQLQVWQKNVMQDTQDQAISSMTNIAHSDPGGFFQKQAELEAGLAEHLKGQPAAEAIAVRSFRELAYTEAIKYNVKVAENASSDADAAAYITTANEYIIRAADFGVDNRVLAELQGDVGDIMDSRQAARVTAGIRNRKVNNMTLEDDQKRQLNNWSVYTERGDTASAYAAIDQIKDPELRKEALQIVEGISNFTANEDLLALQSLADRKNLSASEIMSAAASGDYRVGSSEVTAMANKASSDQKSGVAAVRKEYASLIDAQLLPYTKTTMGKFQAAEAEASRKKALGIINSAVKQADLNGTDPGQAAAAAWNNIMTDPNFDTEYMLFAPQRAGLREIKRAENLTWLDDLPMYTKEDVRKGYVAAVWSIYEKYGVLGVARDSKILSSDLWKAVSPQSRQLFIEDMQAINRQNVYYRTSANDAGAEGTQARTKARLVGKGGSK